jgi:hypothetical protein
MIRTHNQSHKSSEWTQNGWDKQKSQRLEKRATTGKEAFLNEEISIAAIQEKGSAWPDCGAQPWNTVLLSVVEDASDWRE